MLFYARNLKNQLYIRIAKINTIIKQENNNNSYIYIVIRYINMCLTKVFSGKDDTVKPVFNIQENQKLYTMIYRKRFNLYYYITWLLMQTL